MEGPLHQVGGEDGPLFVFNSEIVAQTVDGRTFSNGRIVPGFATSPDGFSVPNVNYQSECLAIIDSLREVREIDDTEFKEIQQPSLEEVMENEAEIERCEREGYAYEAPNPLAPSWIEAHYMVLRHQLEDTLQEEFRKCRAETKQCNDDSCDGSHCVKCGGHMLGWNLPPSTICQSCLLVLNQVTENFNKAHGI